MPQIPLNHAIIPLHLYQKGDDMESFKSENCTREKHQKRKFLEKRKYQG